MLSPQAGDDAHLDPALQRLALQRLLEALLVDPIVGITGQRTFRSSMISWDFCCTSSESTPVPVPFRPLPVLVL